MGTAASDLHLPFMQLHRLEVGAGNATELRLFLCHPVRKSGSKKRLPARNTVQVFALQGNECDTLLHNLGFIYLFFSPPWLRLSRVSGTGQGGEVRSRIEDGAERETMTAVIIKEKKRRGGRRGDDSGDNNNRQQ